MGNIFNRNKYKLHRDRASANIHSCDFLLNYCADDIIYRLNLVEKKFYNILDLGARHGVLTNKIKEKYSTSRIVAIEVSERLLMKITDNSIFKLVSDDENVDIKSISTISSNYDLILSLLNLHWVNDIANFLQQVLQLLTKDGIFIGCFLGDNTLSSLRRKLIETEKILNIDHIPRISPFIRLEDTAKLFQLSGFTSVVTDIETIKVEYSNCLNLMRELRNMGESAKFNRPTSFLPKSVVKILSQIPITENFDVITFLACKDASSLKIKNT